MSEADYEAFEAHRVKHLELIQAVITRLGNDSFLVKGWAVTVSGVFFGFAVTSKEPNLALASMLPTVFFWGLDTYFLRAERLFRALYDRVRAKDEDIEPFAMGATEPAFVSSLADRHTGSWLRTAISLTIAVLYVGLLLSALLVRTAVCHM